MVSTYIMERTLFQEHTIDNLLQSIETRRSTINLSSSMVTDNNTIAANLNTFSSIGNTLDTLDGERLAATHLLPRLDQPRHLLPSVRSSMPDIVYPFGTCFVWLLDRINAILCKPFLEDWVGQAQIGTNTVIESVVAVCDVIMSPSELPCAVKEVSVAA